MPGRDITRLPNRATRLLSLLLFACCALICVCSASTQSPAESQSQEPATSEAPAQQKPQSQDKQESQDQKLNDQGIFVFKKDVDEVLLHASVIDDKQRLVTNLDRNAFTIYEDGKPQ